MKTTKKDFELFQKECRRWQDILGLKDWEIVCVHGQTDSDNLAEYQSNGAGRICTIYFTDDWGNDHRVKDARSVKQTAFHEVAELLLVELRNMALQHASWERVDGATHKVVRTLENVLFPEY